MYIVDIFVQIVVLQIVILLDDSIQADCVDFWFVWQIRKAFEALELEWANQLRVEIVSLFKYRPTYRFLDSSETVLQQLQFLRFLVGYWWILSLCASICASFYCIPFHVDKSSFVLWFVGNFAIKIRFSIFPDIVQIVMIQMSKETPILVPL